MNAEERKAIIARAQNRRAAQAQQGEYAEPAPAPHPAAAAAPQQPYVRATGGAEIRVIDANNPPTPRVRRGGTHVRQAGPSQQGPRVMGARVVPNEELQPGPRMRTPRQPGAYGATVVPQQQPAMPVGQALRTPMAPGPRQAPAAAPRSRAPQGAPAAPAAQQPTAPPAPELSAQISALGRTMGTTGQAPAGPVAVAGTEAQQVWAIMSQHRRPATLERQFLALVAAGIGERHMTCWVNPAGQRLNDGLLGRVPHVRASFDMGPWMRWSMVVAIPTKYTLVIDDDCTPGPDWVRLAVQRLERAEAEGDTLVVAAAGTLFRSDQVEDSVPLGPESLHREETDVDLGRGAWMMPTELARQIMNFPIVGCPLATSIHVAAAAQRNGASIVVLPYPHDNRQVWGMLEAPAVGSMAQRFDQEAKQGQGPDAAAMRRGDYEVYRDIGWEPICVIAAATDEPLGEDEPPDAPPQAS